MSWEQVESRDLSKKYEEQKEDFLFVDVRTEEEYEAGHIPAATYHIPHEEMVNRYTELVEYQDKPILLICRSGVRSEIAAQILADKGFTRLYNLKGGMLEWSGPVK
ncbi:rhodanese-like domain-containing protein [Risungbinella massiliensis]|uniref:rhodanese-like domain-containing protein n=1 Tax=Risungbinella massiliensis TaxID=1329796 RepID=UPI0005CC877F|nr:rhodanese-like domain-containing protein [Risungbinella massiliensis]